jgi:hypothetical protein
VLETPELSAQIQALPAPVLGKLIDRVGLEDAGELVALATTEQLAEIFDADLWHSAHAGQDESFDAGRFLVWLEIMLEAGERFVAERLAELPEELVTLAFQRHLLVVGFDDLQRELASGDDDAEAAQKAFDSCLSEEIEDFQLIWRGGEGWDNVLTAILALDREHHSLLVDLLERCAHLSREHIDDNGGLYEVLSSADMLEADLQAERETRRSERGYVAPSAAAAFLRLSRSGAAAETPFTEHDPVTRAYFRDLSRAAPKMKPAETAGIGQRRELSQLLAASGITVSATPKALLAPPKAERARAGARSRSTEEPLLIAALRLLAADAPAQFAERQEELAYLSNALMAGCSVDGRRLRPLDAVEHAIRSVSFGLSLASGSERPTPEAAARALAQHPCDGLFRLAFSQALATRLEPRLQIDHKALAELQQLLKAMKV